MTTSRIIPQLKHNYLLVFVNVDESGESLFDLEYLQSKKLICHWYVGSLVSNF